MPSKTIIHNGLRDLFERQRIGLPEVAAATRWLNDFELGSEGAINPDATGSDGSTGYDAHIVACIDALSRYGAASRAVGLFGDMLLRSFVAGGLSLRAIERRLAEAQDGRDSEASARKLLIDLIAAHFHATRPTTTNLRLIRRAYRRLEGWGLTRNAARILIQLSLKQGYIEDALIWDLGKHGGTGKAAFQIYKHLRTEGFSPVDVSRSQARILSASSPRGMSGRDLSGALVATLLRLTEHYFELDNSRKRLPAFEYSRMRSERMAAI